MGYPKRLQQASKDLNVGIGIVIDALASYGHYVENKPVTKLSEEQVDILDSIFSSKTVSSNIPVKVSATTIHKLEYLRRKKGNQSHFLNTSEHKTIILQAWRRVMFTCPHLPISMTHSIVRWIW